MCLKNKQKQKKEQKNKNSIVVCVKTPSSQQFQVCPHYHDNKLDVCHHNTISYWFKTAQDVYKYYK